MTPLVSIIIPCFNTEKYVGEAIESALSQTYQEKEILVIDDGSTDDSLRVIRSFGDRICWKSGANRGGSAARNDGIEVSRGEFIQFLDADDLLHAEKLERQMPYSLKEPGVIVYCDYENRDMAGAVVEGNRCPQQVEDDPVCFVLKHYGLQTSAPLHSRRDLRSVGGFRERLPCCQERDLHLRLACAGLRFRHLRETLFTVRKTSDSVSSNFIHVLDQHAEIAWNARSILQENNELTERRSAALAGFLAADARSYLQRGEIEKARGYIRQAQLLHPGGGIDHAYGWATAWLRRMVGPYMTERLVARKRAFWRSGR